MLLWALAVRRTGFAWTGEVMRHAVLILASGMAIHVRAWVSEWAAAGVGTLRAAGWGMFALARLAHASELGGPVGKVAGGARATLMKRGVGVGEGIISVKSIKKNSDRRRFIF